MTAQSGGESVLNPAHYPRSYRYVRWVQITMAGLGAILSCGSLLLASFVLSDADTPSGPRVLLLALLAGVLLLGAYFILSALRFRVTLDTDAIEVVGVLRHRHVPMRDIVGIRRRIVRDSPSSWIIVLTIGAGRNLQISEHLNTDRKFFAWMHSFPNLDREAEEASTAESAEAVRQFESRGYGAGMQKRLRHLATAMNVGSYVLLAALFLWPAQSVLLAWTAIAWPLATIALVARFKPFYRLGGDKVSPLPDLSMSLFIPGLGLMLAVLTTMQTVDWLAPLVSAALGSLMLTGTAAWVDPRLRRQRWAAPMLGVLCCAWGYGAGLEGNALLDRSAPSDYPVRVVSMHVDHGKHTSYHIVVPPWGPLTASDDITVSSARYASTSIGDTLCTSLHEGAFGILWYMLVDCRNVR
jgi:hypothetical protein